MSEPLPAMVEDENSRRRWLGWLLLLPVLGVAYGVWRYDLLGNLRPDYIRLLAMIVAAMAAAAVIAWLFWRRRSGVAAIPSTLAMLVLAGFVYYAGAAAAMAALLLGLAGIAAGGLIDGRRTLSFWSRLIAGLAVIAAVVGWLLPFPVHDPRFYLLAVGSLLLLRHRAVGAQLRVAASGWGELARAHPAWLAFAVLAAGVASLGLALPSLNYDDNVAHLILPDQLLAAGYYRMDVSSQLGAVAAWANNVLHGVATLLAGQEVSGAVNLLWLLLGLSGAYRLALAIGGSRAVALAAAAVFASHPLSAYFASTMQVDGAVAAVLLHLAAELVNGKDRLASPWITGAMLGLLAGLKVSNVVYVLLPLAWWAWCAVRKREPRQLLILVAMAAAVGGSSYAYAMWVTGNPVFPFYNAIFKSPFMPPINFHDARWDSGVDWRAAWDLTFNTSRFGESYPGAAGIALLVTLSGLVVEIARPRGGRWIALWMLVAGALMFWQIQYLRYVFPAIAVLTTVGLVGLSRYTDTRVFAALVVTVVAINAALIPATSWIVRDNPWGRLAREGVSAKAEIQRAVIPERALLDRLQARSPNACVLLTDPRSPFVGSFGGRANAMAWYDPRLSAARSWAEGDPSGGRWQQLLRSVGASHLVLRHQVDTPLANAVEGLGFERIDTEASLGLWADAAVEKRRCDPRFLQQRDQAHRLFHPGDKH